MKLVTHPGAYHTDDCLAVAFIQCIYSDIEVIRSTSPLDIANADFVVDVGGVYDYDTHRFDHHQ